MMEIDKSEEGLDVSSVKLKLTPLASGLRVPFTTKHPILSTAP